MSSAKGGKEKKKKKASQSRKPAKVVNAETATIGFVGAGKLATAIISGLVVYGKVNPKRICVAAPSENNTTQIKRNFPGVRSTRRNIDIFGRLDCDVIFIAVNGNVIRNLYKLGGSRPAPITTNYIPNMRHQLYVLSLVTGFTVKQISQCLLNPEHPEKYKCEMHRIVLNCAVAHGTGVCAVDVEPDSNKLGGPVRVLLSNIAQLEYLPESQMDAACAMVGSGLAFCYYFLNAISDGALKIGLSRAAAVKFAAKTAGCAAETQLQTGQTPNELRDDICAPAGGAVYGLSSMDKADVASAFTTAIEAAFQRAAQLAADSEAK